MFHTLEDALAVLTERKNHTFGIAGLLAANEELGKPHEGLVCIHIGGTNGKGSTTDFTRSVLQNAGYTVGSFTSPHLVTHNDRIRINNIPINDETLLMYINETRPLWEKHMLSMFEIDMLISLLYFKEQKVDVCVYEVGLGGRLDATNIINPRITAITHIDFDHMDILGDTIAKIAGEKAGIIKQGIPLLTTETKIEALNVFKERCEVVNAPFHSIVIPHYTSHQNTVTFERENTVITLTDQPFYQVENASLAWEIVRTFDATIPLETIRESLENTHWAGRFEQVAPSIYVDGAHNINGVEKLVESLELLPRPWTLVFTALRDKRYDDMISKLESVANTLILTEFDFYRAARAEELAKGHNALVITPYQDAIDTGTKIKGSGTLVVTGSLYFISLAREYIVSKSNKQV